MSNHNTEAQRYSLTQQEIDNSGRLAEIVWWTKGVLYLLAALLWMALVVAPLTVLLSLLPARAVESIARSAERVLKGLIRGFHRVLGTDDF